jgi:hypothetical protein
MPFPVTLEGSSLLARADSVDATLLQQAEATLVSQGGIILARSERELTFRVPFERVPLWLFDHGLLTFEDSRVGPVLRYRASCRRAALATGGGAALLGAIVAAGDSWLQGVWVAVLAWLWIFGSHYWIESGNFAGRFAHITNAVRTAAEEAT